MTAASVHTFDDRNIRWLVMDNQQYVLAVLGNADFAALYAAQMGA